MVGSQARHPSDDMGNTLIADAIWSFRRLPRLSTFNESAYRLRMTYIKPYTSLNSSKHLKPTHPVLSGSVLD